MDLFWSLSPLVSFILIVSRLIRGVEEPTHHVHDKRQHEQLKDETAPTKEAKRHAVPETKRHTEPKRRKHRHWHWHHRRSVTRARRRSSSVLPTTSRRRPVRSSASSSHTSAASPSHLRDFICKSGSLRRLIQHRAIRDRPC